MCRVSKRNRGVKVLKRVDNYVLRMRVELTRKTVLSGDVKHCVVITDFNDYIPRHTRIDMYDSLSDALNRYRKATTLV